MLLVTFMVAEVLPRYAHLAPVFVALGYKRYSEEPGDEVYTMSFPFESSTSVNG